MQFCKYLEWFYRERERDLSKIIKSFPTNNEHVELFEKTLTGGLSCVNTGLTFDTEILLTNVENPDKDNWKDYSYKVSYNLKLDGEEKYSTKRVITKILKLDENNRFGYTMTKPMPNGSIKKKFPSWWEFNLLLETVDSDDSIGHLFVVNIFFLTIKTQPKNKIHNEIYPPIIEKQKILDANELWVNQLIKLYSETDKGVPRSYRPTPEAHTTLFFKKVQSLHLEHLEISIGRAGWKVTKLYAHYAFGQERFKKILFWSISVLEKRRKTASKKKL